MNTPRSDGDDVRILVLGTGQLSIALEATAPVHVSVSVCGRDLLDVTDDRAVGSSGVFDGVDAVINTTAFTGVDAAEDPANLAAVTAVNGTAPGLLAARCARTRTPLIHVSTDYVFGHPVAGTAGAEITDFVGLPRRSGDPVSPQSVYGRTKRAGELEVLAADGQASVVRTAWLYTGTALGAGHKGDFVCTMKKLADGGVDPSVVDDQWGSPTFAPDLARWLWRLAGTKIRHARTTVACPGSVCPVAGILHAAGEQPASWCQLAREVFAACGADPRRVRPCTTRGYPSPAPRPAWSVLETTAFDGAPVIPGFGDRVRTAVTDFRPRPATLW